MALFNQPDVNLMQDAQMTGAPMEMYASIINGDKAELKKIISGSYYYSFVIVLVSNY